MTADKFAATFYSGTNSSFVLSEAMRYHLLYHVSTSRIMGTGHNCSYYNIMTVFFSVRFLLFSQMLY